MARSRLLFCRRSALFLIPLALLLAVCVGCGSSGSISNNGGGGTTPPPPPSNANQWTWMGGSNTVGSAGSGQTGVYGTEGVAAANNVPGGRGGSAIWKDQSGNLWLFGGEGIDSAGVDVYLNDLWEFNPTTNQWTWMGGSTTGGAVNGGRPGVYGTQGESSAANIPGGRIDAAAWTDTSGNLWLFGGWGYDSQDNQGDLNDLWEFNLAAKQWIWVSGSTTGGSLSDETGIYGTQGMPATTNTPGGRQSASSWIDSSGNFWLFGGYGADSVSPFPQLGFLNDLWRFDPVAKTWTWISGSNTIGGTGGEPGIYGTEGAAAATNIPGSRDDAGTWTDSNGNFWLFGGYGTDSGTSEGELNDLWEFNTASQQWVWVAGSNTLHGFSTGPLGRINGVLGMYGTEGTPSTANIPGGREGVATWADSSGNLWLFGGEGIDSAGSYGYLNDLWKFNPGSKAWIWMGGENAETQTTAQNTLPYTTGVYGTLGTPSTSNIPGSRLAAVPWIDASGNLWLFGGYGADSTGTEGHLNDMWKYTP